MKLNFKKEILRENFQRTVIFIGAFILIILAIKSGGSISQQNVSTVIVPSVQEVKANPYEVAYKKCTSFKMNSEFTNKCIEWELNNGGVKK